MLESSTFETGSSISPLPIVIGIYGLSGCGKSHLLNALRETLGTHDYTFVDGSSLIVEVSKKTIDEFKKLPEDERSKIREDAIVHLQERCAENGTVGLVTGHYMFWDNKDQDPEVVCTEKDWEVYTHIIYLDEDVEKIAERREDDNRKEVRQRSELPVDHLDLWMKNEISGLRSHCQQHRILFCALKPSKDNSAYFAKVVHMIRDFKDHSYDENLLRAHKAVDDFTNDTPTELETVLVLDGDKTLAAEDTGTIFWQKPEAKYPGMPADPLKELFSGNMQYTYTAFRQAALMYEGMDRDGAFDQVCLEVATEVRMHPEFVSLLQRVGEQSHVGAVVVTAGLRQVWEYILENEGLSGHVKVIGGGRLSDHFVVTGEVKKIVVEQLNAKNLRTIAMGDSSLDLKMLRKAKEGIVVVGEPSSGSMKGAVEGALEERKFTAKQVLLPPTARPLLDSKRLPIVSLTGKEFIASLFAFKQPEDGTQSQSFTGIPSITVIDTTEEPAAKVLTAPTRNNNISGPALRETHRKIGHHLAIQEVTKVIGLETYKIPHVQGGTTPGHRLLHEEQTLIVALMRGGEPMAFGVNNAFPSAMFLHADPPEDIKPEHLKGVITIILVDSVINDGNTIVKFVKAIRRQHATIRIVVVSGVTQRNAVKEECLIAQKLTREEAIGLKIVTLRISDNKFKGVGGIDTGNRLFNTTHWQ